MNKRTLLGEVAYRANVTQKQADAVIKAFSETVQETVAKGEKVCLAGLGNFQPKHRKGRKYRIPNTGELIAVSDHVVPSFNAGKEFKSKVMSNK